MVPKAGNKYCSCSVKKILVSEEDESMLEARNAAGSALERCRQASMLRGFRRRLVIPTAVDALTSEKESCAQWLGSFCNFSPSDIYRPL